MIRPRQHADLSALIERLEVAAEGNRELDIAISEALNLPAVYGTTVDRLVAAYTSSIDTALTLVPEGMVWTVLTDYGGLCRARIYNGQEIWQADGETPALAIVIAALRARAAADVSCNG